MTGDANGRWVGWARGTAPAGRPRSTGWVRVCSGEDPHAVAADLARLAPGRVQQLMWWTGTPWHRAGRTGASAPRPRPAPAPRRWPTRERDVRLALAGRWRTQAELVAALAPGAGLADVAAAVERVVRGLLAAGAVGRRRRAARGRGVPPWEYRLAVAGEGA